MDEVLGHLISRRTRRSRIALEIFSRYVLGDVVERGYNFDYVRDPWDYSSFLTDS